MLYGELWRPWTTKSVVQILHTKKYETIILSVFFGVPIEEGSQSGIYLVKVK